jgi:putative hydrolase of the HAD superfamily
VRNVIFDLGGVVLDWNPGALLDRFYADQQTRAFLKSSLFEHPDWLLMDRGVLSESDVVARLQQRTGRSADELLRLLEAVRQSLQPKPDTVALIERLAQRQVPLYCLSNIPATTYTYLRQRYDFWPAFRGIVISGEINMMKPEREIFEYLLARYSLQAADCVFIDDHEPNVRAAQTLGIRTIWFRDAAQCERELAPLLAPQEF